MKRKKLLSLLLAIGLITTSCGKKTNKNEDVSSSNPKSVVSSEEQSSNSSSEVAIDYTKKGSQTKIITDDAGNKVEIPVNINRIVVGSMLPLPSVYCLYNGAQVGKIVGMHPMSMVAAKNSPLVKAYPEIANADTGFVKNGQINIEEVMKLKPDIAFYEAGHKEEKELYDKAGIPAVGFSTASKDINTTNDLVGRVKTLQQIFEDDKKADKIINYAKDTEKEILDKTKDIKDEDKPKVLILFQYADGTMKTSGKNFFGQYRLDTCGGINVAKDLDRTPEITMEQVYDRNPDMIFITNFSPVTPDQIKNNEIKGDDRSKVKAVQDGKVYKFPMGMYRRFTPSGDTPLTLKRMAKTLQPEVFKDMDIDKEIKDYYEDFYNMTLTDEDLQDIYNPSPAASGQVKTDAQKAN